MIWHYPIKSNRKMYIINAKQQWFVELVTTPEIILMQEKKKLSDKADGVDLHVHRYL